jgi:3-oxoacyl-ACP reductase-like protein
MEASAPATPEVASAPAPAPAPAVAPAPAPAPQMAEGGAMDSVAKPKMNVKDIIISALLVTLSIYGIVYYRKAIKSLDEQVTPEEFDNMAGMIEEHDVNLKKALGSKYKKM